MRRSRAWIPVHLRYVVFFLTRFPRALRPRTLDDKIARKMLRDRREILTHTADKVAVRQYVAGFSPEILSTVYQTITKASDIDWKALPDQVAIKSNHGCSGSIILSDDGTELSQLLNSRGQLPKRWTTYRVLPASVSESDRGILEQYLDWTLSQTYGWGNPNAFTFEWAYRNIKPQILVEELLRDGGQNPIDYRFFVSHGEVSWVQRDYKRAGQHFSSVHLPNWEMLDVRYNYDQPPELPGAPLQLSEMCHFAELLSSRTDFCRVDFYNFAGRVIFGEITHYPRGGNNSFVPSRWATDLATAWSPPWRYEVA